MIRHDIEVTDKGRFPEKPFEVKCPCGTSGDFGSHQEAVNFAQSHFLATAKSFHGASFADKVAA